MAPLDGIELKVSQDIDIYGWSCMAIFDPDGNDLPWSYTVGLTALDHPELAIFGLPPEIAHSVLGTGYERVAKSERLVPNTYSRNFLLGHRVAFVEIVHPRNEDYPLSLVRRMYGDPVQGIQIVWPDKNDLFPWDEDYDPQYDVIPLLGVWAP